MAFEQVRLTKSINQSRDIFDKYIYRSNTDTLTEIRASNYFDQSRYLQSEPEAWIGGIIEVIATDGYAVLQISSDGKSVEDVGTGAFTLGPQQNVFTGANRAAAESARDTYATNNPLWLAEYNSDTGLNIRLEYEDSGNNVAVYQVRNQAGDTWLDNSSAIGIKGDTGAAGATGNSYFFESISARDAFFGTNPNEDLLVNDLPVVVNVGNKTSATFVWQGATAPPTYDPSNWRTSSLETSSGTLILGESGAAISSGNEVLGFTSPSNDKSYIYGVRYDSTGSEHPYYWEFGAESDIPIADVFNQTLTGDQNLQFTGTTSSITTAFTVRPASSGTLRVQSWVGTDDTGPVLYDEDYTITAGQIGSEVKLQFVNDYVGLAGLQTYIRFSGVDLFGGLQTGGIFPGQTTIFLSATVQLGVEFDYISSTKSNTSIDNHIAVFDGGGSDKIKQGSTARIRSTSSSDTPSFDIENSSGSTTFQFEFNEPSNRNKINSTRELDITADFGGIFLSAQGQGEINLTSNETSALPFLKLSQTGLQGSSVALGALSTNPEGITSAAPGSVVYANVGGEGRLYIKRTGISNTGWIEVPVSAFSLSNTPVDNALLTADGTSGSTGKAVNTITASASATASLIVVESPNPTTGTALLSLTNNLGTGGSNWRYDESTNSVEITTASGAALDITAAGDMDITSTSQLDLKSTGGSAVLESGGASSEVVLRSARPGSAAGFLINQTGTDGGSIELAARSTGSPEGNNVGSPGDIVMSGDGNLYLKKTGSVTNTGWEALSTASQAGVTYDNTPVDGALVVNFNNDATKIESVNTMTVTVANGVNPDGRINLNTPSATGSVRYALRNNTGTEQARFEYDQNFGIVSLEAFNNTPLEISGTSAVLLESTSTAATVNLKSAVPSSALGMTFIQNTASYSMGVIASGSPEGVTTGSPGDVVISQSGEVYIKRTGTNTNTGWEALAGTGFNLTNTPQDNAVIIASGTSGLDGEAVNWAKFAQSGNTRSISLESASGSGVPTYSLNASSSAQKGRFIYEETQDRVSLSAEGTANMLINANTSATFQSGGAMVIGPIGTDKLTMSNVAGSVEVGTSTLGQTKITSLEPDTAGGLVIQQQGANGGEGVFHFGTRSPVNNIVATTSNWYFRNDISTPENSDLYLKRDNLTSVGWQGVFETLDELQLEAITLPAQSAMKGNLPTTVSQSLTSAWSPVVGLNNAVLSDTAGVLTNLPDQTNGRMQIGIPQNQTQGDVFRVTVTGIFTASAGIALNYRIAITDGTTDLTPADSLNLSMKNVRFSGVTSNVPITLSGIIRGPAVNNANYYFQPQVQINTGGSSATHYVESLYFSVERVGQ